MTKHGVRKRVELVGCDDWELGRRIDCFLQAVAIRRGIVLHVKRNVAGQQAKRRATILYQIPVSADAEASSA